MITVLGASGFIGSYLVRRLRAAGEECYAPSRGDALDARPLGRVIYCIGLTADFRSRPLDTVKAHVCQLREVLEKCDFEALVYLSSTRVYGTRPGVTEENTMIKVDPANPDHLYNVSKVMGESLAINSGRPCKVARLSNVYGDEFRSDNFLAAIIREAVETGTVTLQTSLESAKDYIRLDQAASLLMKIATESRERIYNVASGVNTTHAAIKESLSRLTGATVSAAPGAPTIVFPRISVRRIHDEFGHMPSNLLDDLGDLVAACQKQRKAEK
jgi:nucleoside-diphosphate-sugar epimerase